MAGSIPPDVRPHLIHRGGPGQPTTHPRIPGGVNLPVDQQHAAIGRDRIPVPPAGQFHPAQLLRGTDVTGITVTVADIRRMSPLRRPVMNEICLP